MPKTTLATAIPMAFIPTKRSDAAKEFYSNTLGLELMTDDEFALVFRLNKSQTLLVQKVHDFTPQPFTICGWQVDNIEVVVTELSERGARFELMGIPTQEKNGVCTFANGDKVAWFKDPDGNMLSITQPALIAKSRR